MAFLKEVTTKEELVPVIACLWDANHHPYEPYLNVVCPTFSDTKEGYDKAFAASIDFFWAGHLEDGDSSKWVCVVDESGNVLSGAHWNFYAASPWAEGVPDIVAEWHPEGEGREFANNVFNQIYRVRGQRLLRPYAQLDLMFTYLKERNKGYGGMIMVWGMQKAREMKLEVFVEASEMAVPLYRKFGLRTIDKLAIDTLKEHPSNTWQRLASDLGNFTIWWMWKPAKGIFEQGKTSLPWITNV